MWLVAERSGSFTGSLTRGDKSVATGTGQKYTSSPEAVSVSINEQGQCYRVTAGYVLDRTKGNTKGLGGDEGLLEAVGAGLPFWETRSFLGKVCGFGDPRACSTNFV